jgi:hypothetical protein
LIIMRMKAASSTIRILAIGHILSFIVCTHKTIPLYSMDYQLYTIIYDILSKLKSF